MKKCDMSVSPAHGVLTPCTEKAIDYIPLGDGSSIYLCEKHYKQMNSLKKKGTPEENYIGENI